MMRAGFTTLEELASTPDEVLLVKVRLFGPRQLARVRAIVPYVRAESAGGEW
jgi:hypothetical protein